MKELGFKYFCIGVNTTDPAEVTEHVDFIMEFIKA